MNQLRTFLSATQKLVISSARGCAGAFRNNAFASLVLAVLAASVLSPTDVLSQQWKCITPSPCGPLVRQDGMASFALRLDRTAAIVGSNVPVTIKISSGNLFVGGQQLSPTAEGLILARTDGRGVLAGYVEGAKDAEEIHVAAEVRVGEFVTQTLQVAAPSVPVVLHTEDGAIVRYAGTQSWDVSAFANGLDGDACRRSVVRFTPRGGTGSVSADSVYGEFDAKHQRCLYSTDWRLGSEVGRQVLQVRAGSAPPREITAIARRRPALRVGLGMGMRRGGFSTRTNARVGDTIRVRRNTPDGYIEFDSIPDARSVVKETADWHPETMPLVLIDGPVPGLLRYDNLRISAGASAINIKRDFFLGIGVMQLFDGVQVEDSGFDIQLGALVSRPERLKNAALCSRDIEASASPAVLEVSCANTEGLRWGGLVGTVSTDAQALFGVIGKVLGL